MSSDITVVIPAYNSEAFIASCLASVLAQTRLPEQIIVVDDGSADRTAEIAACFIPRGVTCIRKVNGGQASARNVGVLNAASTWVAFLDVDDMWAPTFLEKQLVLAASSGAGLVCCDARITRGEKLEEASWYETNGFARVFRGEGAHVLVRDPLKLLVTKGNFVLASSAVVRRDSILRAGMFRQDYDFAEEFELWTRLAPGGAFAVNLEPLVVRRIHSANVSHNRLRMIIAELKALASIESALLPDRGDLRKHIHHRIACSRRELGSLRLGSGDLRGARDAWMSSLKLWLSPVVALYWVLSFLPSNWLRTAQRIRARHRRSDAGVSRA